MKTLASVITVLALPGCVSDFSPDPYKSSGYFAQEDAGHDAGRGVDARVTRPDASSTPPPAEADPPVGTAPATGAAQPSSGCDLSGRWIMTEHSVSSALSAQQVNLGWHYVELTQQGDVLTMQKTLLCGGSTAGLGLFTVMMDDSQAWPAYQKYTNYNGRKGSAKQSGSGCEVTFANAPLVRAMTLDTYRDPSVPLPTAEQEASGATPGWEDWDEDGHPGITMTVSGVASGKIYTSFRTFGAYQGTIASGASTFQLGFEWSQDRAVLGIDPPSANILASDATRDPNESLQFVEFARLSDAQASGDDDARCDAIRTLAPTLNPAANKK